MSNTTGQIDVHRLYAVLADILSEKYDMKVTFTVRPRDPESAEGHEKVPA